MIEQSIHRKEAWDKVTGRAQYADDMPKTGVLCARLLTSLHAHARLLDIDVSIALSVEGVKTVITGKDCPQLFGPLLQDRPALALDTVRYAGEPIAMVVAIDDHTAERVARMIDPVGFCQAWFQESQVIVKQVGVSARAQFDGLVMPAAESHPVTILTLLGLDLGAFLHLAGIERRIDVYQIHALGR